MASDLKIEIFAYNIFHSLWYESGERRTKPNILEVYGDECREENDYKEICDEMFRLAIDFRQQLSHKLYEAEFTDEKAESLKSLLDCYEYVNSTCDRDDLFGHLTVFQRIIATLSFVVHICFQMYENAHDIDVVKYGHMFWATYFDKYTEEFYAKGGWEKLKKVVKLSESVDEFSFYFHEDALFNIQATKEACVNYFQFKNAVDYHERKEKHPIHFSYLWIKFRIEHFESYIRIPSSYEFSVDIHQVELLLEDLESILDPKRCNSDCLETSKENYGSLLSTGISCSENYCHQEDMKSIEDDLLEKKNTEEKLKINVNKMNEIQGKVSQSKGIDAPSTNQMVAPDSGLSSWPTLKGLSSVNENVNRDEERIRIIKARAVLRNEQKDSEVKDILKFLLVLGDKEGIEFVCSRLQKLTQKSLNSQRSNKQTKKSKKTKM